MTQQSDVIDWGQGSPVSGEGDNTEAEAAQASPTTIIML